ncbi:MAG: nucleoside 2-deoxyribosyltransferase [Pseudomonadota bacterium]
MHETAEAEDAGRAVRRPRVYLAGPDVFLPDPMAAGRAKVRRADAHGLDGVFPLDAALELDGLAPDEKARRIALANEALMRSCDAAIANACPFRGVSMDSGTAFEVGFMRALGRPVVGYTHTAVPFADRSRAFRDRAQLTFDYDGPDLEIEDFGLAENLMITVAMGESGLPMVVGRDTVAADGIIAADAFEACLTWLAATL